MAAFVENGQFRYEGTRIPLAEIRNVQVTSTMGGKAIRLPEWIFAAIGFGIFLTGCLMMTSGADKPEGIDEGRNVIYTAMIPLGISGVLGWFRKRSSTKLVIQTSAQTFEIRVDEKTALIMRAEIVQAQS